MRRTATVRKAVSFLLGGFLLTCPAGRLNISRDLWAQQGPQAATFSGKIVSQNDVRLVLRDDDNAVWYHLDDQEKARQFFGKDVLITGTLDGLSGTIRVQSIVEGKPPATPPADDMKQNSEPAKSGTAAPANSDAVTPSVRQASPVQPPSGDAPTSRADSVRTENEAMHRPQGEVSTSPVREAAPTFLLTLPEEAVSASSSVAISSRRLVPILPVSTGKGCQQRIWWLVDCLDAWILLTHQMLCSNALTVRCGYVPRSARTGRCRASNR